MSVVSSIIGAISKLISFVTSGFVLVARAFGKIFTALSFKNIKKQTKITRGILYRSSSATISGAQGAVGSVSAGLNKGNQIRQVQFSILQFVAERSWAVVLLTFSVFGFIVLYIFYGLSGLGRFIAFVFEILDNIVERLNEEIIYPIGKKRTGYAVALFLFFGFFVYLFALIVSLLKCVARSVEAIYANGILIIMTLSLLTLFFIADYMMAYGVNVAAAGTQMFTGYLTGLLGIINFLLDVWFIVQPYVDATSREFYLITVGFYEAVTGNRRIPQCTLGRNLQTASVIDMSSFMTTMQESSFQIAFVQTLITDLYVFAMRIVVALFSNPIIFTILKVIAIIGYKILCFIMGLVFGSGCGFLELLNAIFSFLGPFNPVPVCSGGDLRQLGIPCSCAGFLFSSSQGFYTGLETTCGVQRRVLHCDRVGMSSWVETIDGQSVHQTDNEDDACLHVSHTFDSVKNARLFEKFNIKDCLDVCMEGVGFRSCHDTQGEHWQEMTGACSRRKENVNFKDGFAYARRKLARFGELKEKRMSRESATNQLKDDVPMRFTSKTGVECDLTRSTWSSPFEIAIDMFCIAERVVSQHYKPMVATLEHQKRDLSFVDEKIDHLMNKLRLVNSLPANMTHLEKMMYFTERSPEGLHMFKPPLHSLLEKIEEVKGRRTLYNIYTKCGELFECCDKSCVPLEEMDTCPLCPEYTLPDQISNFFINLDVYRSNFNVPRIFSSILECWDEYQCNRLTDPYYEPNLVPGPKPGVKWCFPMIGPIEQRFDEVTFNFLKSVMPSICGSPENPYEECQCSEYYSVYVQANWFAYVSESVLARCYNAGLSVSTLWYGMLGVGTQAELVCAARHFDNIIFFVLLVVFIYVLLFGCVPFIDWLIVYNLFPLYFILTCGRLPAQSARLSYLRERVETIDAQLRNGLQKDTTQLEARLLKKLKHYVKTAKASVV